MFSLFIYMTGNGLAGVVEPYLIPKLSYIIIWFFFFFTTNL